MSHIDDKYREIEEGYGKGTVDAVRELQSLFTDGLIEWIAGLWDKDRGGFYYSNSARDNDEFLPDIESTGQALSHLEMLGIVDAPEDLPASVRKKLAAFAQNMQDKDDGYFYHEQWGKNINDSRRGRDLSNACLTLKWAGSKPLYPTALERLNANSGGETDLSVVSANLRSREAFVSYLESLDLPADPYAKGHVLASQAAEIKAAGLADVCADFLTSHQLENGMWSGEYNYYAASAMLKISGAYQVLGKEFPNPDKALLAAIKIALNTDKVGCTVEVYNPICTVQNIFDNVRNTGKGELLYRGKQILRDNAERLVRTTAEKISAFRREDGSFSYLRDRSTPRSQMVTVSLGLCEGDMNATALMDSSRARCLAILGIDGMKPCTPEARKMFFEKVK